MHHEMRASATHSVAWSAGVDDSWRAARSGPTLANGRRSQLDRSKGRLVVGNYPTLIVGTFVALQKYERERTTATPRCCQSRDCPRDRLVKHATAHAIAW